MRKVRLVILLGTVLFVAIVFFYIYSCFQEETLLQTGEKIINYLENSEIDPLLNYLQEDEKEALGINKVSMNAFVSYFHDRLNGFSRDKELKLLPVTENYELLISSFYQHKDGRLTDLTIKIYKTDQGNKVDLLIGSMLFCVLNTYNDATKPFPHGSERIKFWTNAIRTALPSLKATGLRGIALQRDRNAQLIFHSFDELLDEYEMKVKSFERK